MGTLNYGSWAVEFDDRLLTHLQIVIVNRLRRGESVLMSWLDALAAGDGRNSIWLTNSTPIYFKFNGSRVPAIDRERIARLEESAASTTGLLVTDGARTPVRSVGFDLTHLAGPQPGLNIPRRP